MFIFPLCIFFAEVCPFRSFVHFLNQVVSLLLLTKSSLYVLDNCALSDVSFANIFSHFVACLRLLLTLSFEEVFNFNKA